MDLRTPIPKLLVLVGLCCWLGAAFTAAQNAYLLGRGERVDAVVTGARIERSVDGDGFKHTNRYTQYAFDYEGHAYRGETSVTGMGTRFYSAHDPLPVLFLPASPEENVVNDFGQMWLGASLMFGAGLLFMVLGPAMARLERVRGPADPGFTITP